MQNKNITSISMYGTFYLIISVRTLKNYQKKSPIIGEEILKWGNFYLAKCGILKTV